MESPESKTTQPPSRRKFLTGAVAALTLAACGKKEESAPAAGGESPKAPAVAAKDSPIVLRMQGSWGAKDIFNEWAEN